MKITNLIPFLLLLSFGVMFHACKPSKCDETFYRINEVRFPSFFSKNGAQVFSFYSTNAAVVDTIAKSDTLGMSLAFLANYYAAKKQTPNLDFSFFPTANADRIPCVPGQKGTNETVTKVTITSNENFNSQHAKNQSLNDLCFLPNSTNGNFNVPLNSVLTQIYAENQSVPLASTNLGQQLTILIKAKPYAGSQHVFTISVELSNGTKLSCNSANILFL